MNVASPFNMDIHSTVQIYKIYAEYNTASRGLIHNRVSVVTHQLCSQIFGTLCTKRKGHTLFISITQTSNSILKCPDPEPSGGMIDRQQPKLPRMFTPKFSAPRTLVHEMFN